MIGALFRLVSVLDETFCQPEQLGISGKRRPNTFNHL
jgi:hypothetical protein